jgi:hypothetical protein
MGRPILPIAEGGTSAGGRPSAAPAPRPRPSDPLATAALDFTLSTVNGMNSSTVSWCPATDPRSASVRCCRGYRSPVEPPSPRSAPIGTGARGRSRRFVAPSESGRDLGLVADVDGDLDVIAINGGREAYVQAIEVSALRLTNTLHEPLVAW